MGVVVDKGEGGGGWGKRMRSTGLKAELAAAVMT